MKRERGEGDDNKNENEYNIHIQLMDIGPQMRACSGMEMMLLRPDILKWEQAHALTIEDITAIRALRKTIEDSMFHPKFGSIDEWKSTIATAVDSFCRMPAKYTIMRDPNDEQGFKRIASGIREILQGKSVTDMIKKQDEEEEEKRKKEQQEEVEPDTKKVKQENN